MTSGENLVAISASICRVLPGVCGHASAALEASARALRNFSMSGSTSPTRRRPPPQPSADDDWRYTGTPAPLLLAPMVNGP